MSFIIRIIFLEEFLCTFLVKKKLKTMNKFKPIIGRLAKKIKINKKFMIIYFHQKFSFKKPKQLIPSINKNKKNSIIV